MGTRNPATPARQVPALRLSPRGRRGVLAVMVVGAVVGALLGLQTLLFHLSTDPLIDIRRYYEAGARLNAGLPLYGQTSADTTATYLNPPLLAILFRPLALLPFPVAAILWEAVVIASLALTVRRVGVGRPVLLVLGWLALPIGWALAIGQVEVVLTLLLALGTPAAVALAGSVKLLPWAAAIYWVGRRDGPALARFVIVVVALWLLQLVVEPTATVAFLQGQWLEASLEVRNVSLWVIHPIVWLGGALVAGVVAFRLAPATRGWAAAVALTVLVNPRLLVYQVMALLAAFGGPDHDPPPSPVMASTPPAEPTA